MSVNLTPRLTSSTQWTELPKEFVEKVKSVFVEEFSVESARGEFMVDGRIYPQELVVRVGYLEKGRLKQVNFEASMDRPMPKSAAQSPDSEAGVEIDDDSSADTYDRKNSSKRSGNSTIDRLYCCIDALGSVMEEFFDLEDEEDLDVPLRWREYDFEGETVYLQHSTVNTRLEEEADRLLGLLGEDLVRESNKGSDAMNSAEVDSELAFEIQQAIRSGKYKDPRGLEANEEELN